DILQGLYWKGTVNYPKTPIDIKRHLRFIRPLPYKTSLHFMHKKFGLHPLLHGDIQHDNYSPEYGEDHTPAYKIWNISADYAFNFKNYRTMLQVGAENLFNEYYSTYADWGNIPRMGRNIFTSLKVNF